MSIQTVLISGASVAGPALAFWLQHYGMRPILVERAPGLRPGGQSVDIRGIGRQVVQRMGIEQAIRKAWTGEQGIAFVSADDKPRASIAAETFGGEGPVAELEILRGDLAAILYEQTRGTCEYFFGNQIVALTEQGNRVHVKLLGGQDLKVDVVVGADGINSSTRRLIFGKRAVSHPLGVYMAYFTIPRQSTDGRWARWFNAPGGRVAVLRPDNAGTTRALLTFVSAPRNYENLDSRAQRRQLQKIFENVGWEVPRILAALEDTQDFYFESIGQVRQPCWSSGRVVLLGDAAYCASPISGMGTSLALVGAYILAGEMANNISSASDAFASYERHMRPYVKRAQKLPMGAPRAALPLSSAGITLMHTILRMVNVPGIHHVLRRLLVPPADAMDLPNYANSYVRHHGAA